MCNGLVWMNVQNEEIEDRLSSVQFHPVQPFDTRGTKV